MWSVMAIADIVLTDRVLIVQWAGPREKQDEDPKTPRINKDIERLLRLTGIEE